MDGAALALGTTGVVVLGASIAGARPIRAGERRLFRAVNRLPGWLYWPLWVPMQLGNLVVGAAAGLLVASWCRSWPMAASVVAGVVLKLLAEKVLRTRLTTIAATRQRPGITQPGAILRGDVPHEGPSFPSGHVILVTVVACAVTDRIPGVVTWVPLALAVVVMFGRVYVGAHNPLDVTAGLGTGLVLGGVLLLLTP